jgi:hypothetical protein
MQAEYKSKIYFDFVEAQPTLAEGSPNTYDDREGAYFEAR